MFPPEKGIKLSDPVLHLQLLTPTHVALTLGTPSMPTSRLLSGLHGPPVPSHTPPVRAHTHMDPTSQLQTIHVFSALQKGQGRLT